MFRSMRARAQALLVRVLMFVSLSVLFAIPAQAQTSAAVTKGVAWLNSQVQSDGSLSGEAQSMALPMQARSDAALTLKQLATLPASIPANVAAITDNNTQYLARKIVVLGAAGADTSALLAVLTPRQNYDGGFGGGFGYSSDTISTSWAVLALAQAGQGGSAAAGNARNYLAGQINPAGGVYDSTLASQLLASAIVLQALETAPDSSSAAVVSNLVAWLKQQQSADGSWTDNTLLSAYVLLALGPVNSDSTINGNAASYLLSKQAGDGSWGDDPYLSAIALRALTVQPAASASPSAIQGQVVSSAGNLPLAGASITVIGGSASTLTDSKGNFTLTGLAAGSYSIGVAASGYTGVTKSATAVSGQTTNLGVIGLAQTATSAIVSGQVVIAGGSTPLAGAGVSISGAATATAVTDASGHYVITGVTPGAVTITVSLSGYQTVTANTTLVGGQTVSFSPGLTANGQTAPTSIVYSGNVVSASTHAALAGVKVQLSGGATSSTTTDASGNFSFTVSPGTYSVAFTLAGYTGAAQTFAAAAGTNVNGGTIALTPVLTSSTVQGQVLNASSQPVAGAIVQIVGGAQATTAADGSYSIANVSGLSLSVRASATGYNTQTINLTLSQPGLVTQNFTLDGQSSGTLTIGALSVAPASVGLRSNITVATSFTNGGTAAASAILQLQVSDSSGNIAGNGTAFDSNGNQMGQINLNGGQSIPVNFVWNSGQFAPGVYQLKVRLVQPGSLSRLTPQGTALAESAVSATVTGQLHFSGTVAANPPVLQAGTNTVVQFTATIKNDGNIALPAQALNLVVTNAANGNVVTQGTANIAPAPVSGLQTISFPNWTPSAGGNYNLAVSASDPTLGSLSGTVYVGDAGSATYTVNKQVVPTGTQTVRGSVAVTGQNVANGTISDPLAPLIKTAVQTAIPYGYATAASDTLGSQCTRCHIQTQALVGGELTMNLTNYASYATSRNVILNSLTTSQQSNGAIAGYEGNPQGYGLTQSMLGMWALNTWHNPAEIGPTLTKGARYLASIQNSDGTWSLDYGSGWWASTMNFTAFNVKSMADVSKKLPQMPAAGEVDYSATVLSNQNISGPYGLSSDASGKLYAVNWNAGTVTQVNPDGTTQAYMSGLSNPSALVFAADGTAYVSSQGGLYHRNADGSMTQVTPRSGSGLAMGPDGNLYMSSYWDNKISMITPAGVVSDYIVGGALNNPWGITFTAAGDLLVASYNGQSIVRYHADLTQDVPVGWTNGGVRNIQATANGWLVTADSGLFFYDTDLHAERRLYTAMGGVATTPDGSIYVGDIGANAVSKLTGTPIDIAGLQTTLGNGIGLGANWLLQDGNVSSSNNLQSAERLIGLNAAYQYYQGQPMAATLLAKMQQVGAQLRANVNADGGWGLTTGYTSSDSLVTAQVGIALDSLNPSASDPIVQNAVKWVLSRQQPDGTWISENGVMGTPLATTTWVSIWLPIILDRLGGIDTDLSVTFPANVAMSNPDTAPTSVTPNADGTNTALWHLTGVTSAGQTVNYDLTLQNMLANEVRAVSTDAHLTFNNSFTNGTVNAPITVPSVTGSAYLNLGLATDNSSYPSNTAVNVTASVANVAATASSGTVKFDIVAPDGSEVASLGTTPFNQLAGNSSANLPALWNTGSYAAASGYAAVATLYDSNGTLVATVKAPFAITASSTGTGTGSGGANATVGQSTDKQTYQPNDTVNLTDKLANTSSNVALGPLTVTTNVVNASGTSIFSKTEALTQLVAGMQKSYAYSIALHGAAAGNYQASVIVTDAKGNTVTQAQAAFAVASSATNGSGLTGTISVGASQVPIGTPVNLLFSATNSGNSLLSNLPLTVSIVDPVAQKVLASYPTTQNIAVGTSYAGNDSWTSAGTVGNNYVAVLSATVGGTSLTLAQTTFTLIVPPYKLGSTQSLWNNNRVLVLTTCNDDDEYDDRHEAMMEEKNQQGSGGSSKACTSARYKALDSALTALGITHLMTTDSTSFTIAMRGGLYDTLWIAQEQSACGDDMTNEVIEVVYHGATLIVDGNVSQDNLGFDRIGGVKSQQGWYGDYSQCTPGGQGSTQSVNFNGNFYGSAQTLTATGNFRSLTPLSGATVEAVYSKLSKQPAAMITNTYGAGRTLISGFDWGSSMAAAPSSQAAAWNKVLGATLAAVTPQASATLTPGQYLPVQTVVTNQGSAVGVDVLSTLPQGALYLGSNPVATFNTGADSADWDFSLAVSASQTLDIAMRAPAAGGSYSMQTVVSTVAGGNTTPYGNPLAFPVTVIAAATHAANATAGLQALSLANKSDQSLRTKLLASLNQAMSDFKLNTYNGYGKAIGELVALADGVTSFSAANATAEGQIRAEVDAILQEAQWRWGLLRPEVTSEIDLDKSQCSPGDTVTLTASLTNVSPGTLSGLTVATKVTDPTGALFLSKSELLPQLAAQASHSYRYPEPLKGAVGGTYQVTLTITDANGNVLAQSSGSFKVGSGSGGQGH